MLAALDFSRWPARARVNRVHVAAGFAVSGVFLALSVRQVDFGRFGQALRGADYWYVGAAVIVYFLDLAVRSWRWQILLQPTQQTSLLRLYRALAIGYMVNNVLPGRVGELARAYVAGEGREGRSSAALASVALERILDGVSVLVLLSLTVQTLAHASWVSTLMRAGAVVFSLGLLCCALMLKERARCAEALGRALAKLPQVARNRIVTLFEHFIGGLATLRRPKQLVSTAALSILVWIVGSVIYILVAAAFGVHLSLAQALAAICLVNLATALPQAPAGLGVFEAVTRQAFVLLGVGASTAFGVTVTLHAVLVFPVVLTGVFVLLPRAVLPRRIAGARMIETRS